MKTNVLSCEVVFFSGETVIWIQRSLIEEQGIKDTPRFGFFFFVLWFEWNCFFCNNGKEREIRKSNEVNELDIVWKRYFIILSMTKKTHGK